MKPNSCRRGKRPPRSAPTPLVPVNLERRPLVVVAADGGASAAPSFEQTILDLLREAGVHNTFKGEETRCERFVAGRP